jgi:hypothetical protein
MKHLATGLMLALTLGIFGAVAHADGKIYIPMESVPARIPYQRAFLVFDEGYETMLVQSKYELSRSASIGALGWVVPVPAAPEIAVLDEEAVWNIFFRLSRGTRPEVRYISRTVGVIVGIVAMLYLPACAVFLVLCYVRPSLRERLHLSDSPRRGLRKKMGFPAFLAFSFLGLGLLSVTTHAGRMDGIEVVKAQRAGIYDVEVIRAASSDAIVTWLQENGFAFGAEDRQVLQQYVARGWCFVTAKVGEAEESGRSGTAPEGLADPLVLRFATPAPVYPLALTSTGAAKTEVLLYTLSDGKLTCGSRLPLRYAGWQEWKVAPPSEGDPQPDLLAWLFPQTGTKSMVLCKFKGRLTPGQMKEDLVFERAADSEPFRERRTTW